VSATHNGASSWFAGLKGSLPIGTAGGNSVGKGQVFMTIV
jgi:hypothetical protein